MHLRKNPLWPGRSASKGIAIVLSPYSGPYVDFSISPHRTSVKRYRGTKCYPKLLKFPREPHGTHLLDRTRN